MFALKNELYALDFYRTDLRGVSRVGGKKASPGELFNLLKHSSLHSSAGLIVGCSDYPAGEIERLSSPLIVFHNKITKLAATDINCLSAMHYAVEFCRVENIVVVGHHGCRCLKAATENRQWDVLNVGYVLLCDWGLNQILLE